MKEERNSLDQYYFVPLGRERGSYLDLLDLPPTASIGEAKKAEVQYKKSIEKVFKSKRKELRLKLKDNTITQEEFDERVKEWEDEKTQKNIELNKLNENFKKAQAEKRKLQNRGIKDKSVVWLEMYKGYDREGFFKEWLSGNKPLRRIDQDQLNSLKSFLSDFEALQTGKMPGTCFRGFAGENAQPSLSGFHEIIDNKKIASLLWADTLWEKLKYTNRSFWQRKVKDWKDEMNGSFPRLKHVSDSISFDKNPLFSSLCALSDLDIDSLKTEKIEEHAQMPERRGDQEQLDLRRLLAGAFEKNLSQESDSGSGDDTKSEEDLLKMFMEMLSAGFAAKN